jgi:hypothetical protein
MTDEAINKAIAEFAGYKFVVFNKGWKGWIFARNSEVQVNIPDYCNDSNAMRKVLLKLISTEQQNQYINNIAEVCWADVSRSNNQVVFNQLTASARQQAIAFVKTIEK